MQFKSLKILSRSWNLELKLSCFFRSLDELACMWEYLNLLTPMTQIINSDYIVTISYFGDRELLRILKNRENLERLEFQDHVFLNITNINRIYHKRLNCVVLLSTSQTHNIFECFRKQ